MNKRGVRKLLEEAWYRGRLNFLWHSGQQRINEIFNQSLGQLFVGNISRQWGKSYWATSKAIQFCIQNSRSRVRYGTAFHTDLVEFIIPTFELVLASCPRHMRPQYKIAGSKFVFANGAQIKLIGLDKNPNAMRGNKLDMIIIDEAGFVTCLDYLYKSVIIPATTHSPHCRIIMISTPPSTPAHPFVDFISKAEVDGCYAHLTIHDNPLVDQATIERLMKESGGETSTTWRREYLGEVVTDEDLAIIREWKDDYIQDLERDEYYGYYHKYIGMDLGTKDYTAAIYGYYDFKRASLVIEDEFHLSGPSMNTEILVNQIKQKETELWGEQKAFRRICDNNWPLMVMDLNSLHSLCFIPTDKEKLESMINEVRIMVQNGQILVHSRCKYLIGCLRYGVWNERRTEFARSKVYGHFDHIAALIYLVRNLAKSTNPIPLDHGHEGIRSWKHGLKGREFSPNVRTLEKALMHNNLERKLIHGNKKR